MTNKEFAEMYAGREVELNGYGGGEYIVGYYASGYGNSGSIVIYAPNYSSRGFRVDQFDAARLTLFIPVKFEYRLIHFSSQTQVQLIEKPIPIKLYSGRCKVCSSPARINKGSVFCSNVKCKSWRKIRSAKPQPPPTRSDRYIRCGLCGEYAVGGESGTAGFEWAYRCINGHTVNYIPQEGDLLMTSLSRLRRDERGDFDYERINSMWSHFRWRERK